MLFSTATLTKPTTTPQENHQNTTTHATITTTTKSEIKERSKKVKITNKFYYKNFKRERIDNGFVVRLAGAIGMVRLAGAIGMVRLAGAIGTVRLAVRGATISGLWVRSVTRRCDPRGVTRSASGFIGDLVQAGSRTMARQSCRWCDNLSTLSVSLSTRGSEMARRSR